VCRTQLRRVDPAVATGRGSPPASHKSRARPTDDARER
jgi:hypothetical protein